MTQNKINQDQKGYTLNANLIPLVIIILIIIGAGYFLLQGEIKLPKLTKDRTEVTRFEGYPTTVANKNDVQKQRVEIKNQQQLSEFLNNVDPSGILTVNENIDFDKELLIGASTERLDTNGYELKIKKVYVDEENNKLVISVVESRPGETCEIEDYQNVAVDLVSISKSNEEMEIEYERVIQFDECN